MSIHKLIRIVYLVIITFALTLAAVVASAQAPTAKQEQLIKAYAQAYKLDHNLLLAIAQVESGFDSHAKGALGEIGLFQLRPEFHPTAAEGDDQSNVATATLYLAQLRRRCSTYYGNAWFLCFNHGPNRKIKNPKSTDYYKKVKTIYDQRLADAKRQAAPHGR